jgi:predicted RNA binding protein YcfA (HicA-like mRNA interferase family)
MSPKLPSVSCEQLVRALKRAGFVEQRQRGSHLHLRREADKKRVTVPMHKRHAIPPGTLRSILRDAGITVEEFGELL